MQHVNAFRVNEMDKLFTVLFFSVRDISMFSTELTQTIKKFHISDLYSYTLIHVIESCMSSPRPNHKTRKLVRSSKQFRSSHECTSSSQCDWLMTLAKFDE